MDGTGKGSCGKTVIWISNGTAGRHSQVNKHDHGTIAQTARDTEAIGYPGLLIYNFLLNTFQ